MLHTPEQKPMLGGAARHQHDVGPSEHLREHAACISPEARLAPPPNVAQLFLTILSCLFASRPRGFDQFITGASVELKVSLHWRAKSDWGRIKVATG